MIQITADTRRAVVTNKELLTTGSAGIQVEFTLSEDWAGLAKVAVFRQGDEGQKVDVVLDSSLTCVVPPEVLTLDGEVVFIGVYGHNGQGTVIIPTIWASAGIVKPGTEPATPASAEPTPAIWAQILDVAQDAEETATEAMSLVESGLQDLTELEASVEAAESSRVDADQSRVTAENQRVDAENSRVLAENTRIANENERDDAETARAAAEGSRVSAENARASAETARVSAEQERVAAEQYREEKYAEYVETVSGYADNASASATAAAGSASNAATSASEAAASADQASSFATDAAASSSQASSSAASASASATAASTSETNAANSATAAAGSASAAATSAQNASNSATAAAGSATTAQTAQSAAEDAQDAAETAADEAKTAVTHYPKIVDGYWYVWNAETETWVNTEIRAEGRDGYSPEVTITEIEGGHRVTITDEDHPQGQTFDVMDGQGGGSGTSDYAELENKPQINGHTLDGNQSASYLGLGTYSKPASGIPKTDLASDVQTSLGKADSALQTAPVTSVNSKTGAVTLGAGDVGYDGQATYQSGTVGYEVSELSRQLSDVEENQIPELKNAIDAIDNTVFTETNLIDASNYIVSKTSYAPTNNGDGTWTFGTDNYGTTAWQSIDVVPAGKYVLQGSPYGYTFVTTNTLYSGVIKTNRTGSDVEFENPSSQVLYIGVRTDSRPPEEFVFYPHINDKELNVVSKNQGSENAGKVLAVDQDGNVIPDDVTVDVDNTLTQQGAAADAKVTGDRIANLESMTQPIVHTIHHVVQVSGTSGGSVEANIGIIIPRGSNATITASTDIMYRGDSIQVGYNSNPLMIYLRQTFSGHALYDAPVTIDVPDGDSFIQAVRVGLGNIENTSGVIDITVAFTTGENLVGMENILPYKTGENLINPNLVYNHVDMNAISGYTTRATSDISVCWVPIVAGGTVTFNKKILKMAIVDKVFEGTFNVAELVSGTKITNSQDTDAYVLFNVGTSVFADLIAVNGEYPADYKPYNIIGGYVESTLDRTYGTISMYYPDEGENVKRIDSNQNPNRLRFVHISDTHQSNDFPIKCMGEFTDLSAAKFLTITGDLINNTIDNDITKTNTQILAMGKPCYICMGNHDVWNDTSPTQRYTKYFNPIAGHNDVPTDVSYYAVDFTTEHVKCIWLDIYELSTGTPSFEMSSTQINWFFSQLDDAIANNYHVCVFLHQSLTAINDPINTFFDYSMLSAPESALKWILDTINAFQNATAVEFEHNGNSFSHVFAGNGVFVAYFNGHTHYDSVGWLKNYNQFNVTINRFTTSGESYDMVYRGEKLNIVANYVAIDTYARRLSVVRIGNNNTIAGIKRDAFTVIY